MNNSQIPTARRSGLVIQEVPGEVLVYDTESNKAHCLNETAALVWQSCDGTNTVSDIAGIVGNKTGARVTDDLVWLAIDQLVENNLLEIELKAKFEGTTRRDAIKKIGLASMIALPIVASLVAPRSAMANVSCGCVAVIPDCTEFDCPTNNCSVDGVCI
jgi:hypothetical protein